MSEAPAPAPGFYGKLPAVGDFVSRRLPRSFIDPWDQWLQNAVASSRERLEARWLDLYLTSPIWRFALAADVCGPTAWAGVLMPSVDRVGRYFPMTIALALPKGAGAASLPGETDWYQRAERAVLSALEGDGAGVGQFDRVVAELGSVCVPVADAQAASHSTTENRGCRLEAGSGHGLPGLVPALAHGLLVQRYGPYSLWWSEGSEQVDPSLLVSAALPAAERFTDMLGGGWPPDAWEVWPRYRSALESADPGSSG